MKCSLCRHKKLSQVHRGLCLHSNSVPSFSDVNFETTQPFWDFLCWYLLGSVRNVTKMLFKKVECSFQTSPVYTNFQEKESTFFFSLETHKIPPGGLNTNILCHAFDWLVLLLFTTYTPSLCSPAELHSVPSAFHYPGSGSKEKSLPLKTRFWMSTSAILAVEFVVFCVAQWWFF